MPNVPYLCSCSWVVWPALVSGELEELNGACRVLDGVLRMGQAGASLCVSMCAEPGKTSFPLVSSLHGLEWHNTNQLAFCLFF